MKKLINLLLVLAVALVQLVPTSYVKAETISGTNASPNNSGKITITKAIKDKTYTIYKIFDLESYSYDKDEDGKITNEAYSYKVASNWNGFINQKDEDENYVILNKYVNVDDDGYVTWVEGADVNEFAKLAIAYAKTNGIANNGSKKAVGTTVEFTGLALGYYLVDSTVGTLCGLNTTNPNVTIEEKNGTPTAEKEVKNKNNWGSESNAQIGDTVEFRTTITVQKGAENYKLVDTMTDGLTFNKDSIVVKIGDTVVDKSKYAVSYDVNGHTFEILFDNTYITSLAEGTKIVVTYSAVLNKKANVCYANAASNTSVCDSNNNTIYLEYGDTNDLSKTPESTTKTYTYGFDLIKTKGESDNVLEGAIFELYSDSALTKKVELIKVSDGVYRVKTSEDVNLESSDIEVGTAVIKGLDKDVTYYLKEIKAPEGYNILTSAVIVNIGGRETNGTTVTAIPTTIKVANFTGNELPSTGGMGTTLFITIGSLLTLAFGTILVTKLRMSKMEI